jgi:hypothetical protein
MAIEYPFENVWPAPLLAESKNGQSRLDADDLFDLGANVAQMADGRVFTDVFPLKHWKRNTIGPDLPAGHTLVYDPKSRRWIQFGRTSGVPVSYYTISGARWIATGGPGMGGPPLTAFSNAVATPEGTILIGGTPSTSSTARLRESNDGGVTWTNRNVGKNNVDPVVAVAHSKTWGRWFCSINPVASDPEVEGIWTSTDKINWTHSKSVAAPAHFVVREADPAGRYPAMILATTLLQDFGVNAYGFSTNGVDWIFARPESFFGVGVETSQGTWNAYHERFVLAGAQGIFASHSGNQNDWERMSTDMAFPSPSTTIASFGRALLRSDGKASIDCGRTWFAVFEASGSDFNVHSVEGVWVGLSRITGGNDQRLSFLVGY